MTRPARLRLRWRLLIYSAPVAAVSMVVIIKLTSVVLAGDSAASAFAIGDGNAVRTDAAILGMANVVEPAKAPFAAGTAAVLDGKLGEADADFSVSLTRTDVLESCPVRVNLELVRETQGDRAVAAGDRARAEERYASALEIVNHAPQGCFAGNADADPQRGAIRRTAANRLAAKRVALNAPPPIVPSRPPAPPPAPPPPPPPPIAGTLDGRESQPRRLDPSGGDPFDKLLQLLQDAAGGSD